MYDLSDFKELTDRIKEIALEFAPEYPNIESVSYFEQLYAIECTIKGIKTANDDLHKLLKDT